MWEFPQYTLGERAFSSLFWVSLEAAEAAVGAGVRAGARASKTALRIQCKLSSEYLETGVAAAKNVDLGGLLGCFKKFNLGSREKSGGAIEKEGVMEKRSWRGQLRPYIEVILALIFF